MAVSGSGQEDQKIVMLKKKMHSNLYLNFHFDIYKYRLLDTKKFII